MFSVLMILWQTHHNLPQTRNIRDTGEVTQPTRITIGSVVFQPRPK